MMLSRQKCRCFLVIAALLIFIAPAFAQQKAGEIININQKYRIAFTDLTEAVVQPGDGIEVRTADGKKLIFQAIEVYPVMVKLAIPADIADSDLAGVSVGAKVSVVGSMPAKEREKKTVSPKPLPAAAQGDDVPGTVETFMPSAGNGPRTAPVKQVTPVPSAPEKPVRREAPPVKTPVVVPAPAPVVPAAVQELLPVVTGTSMPADEKMDRLITNNINLSEHLSRMLTEKSEMEAALKTKDEALRTTRQRNEELAGANILLEAQVKALQTEVDRLKARNADREKDVTDLNEKLTELKKKLARMVEIVNKQLKSYE